MAGAEGVLGGSRAQRGSKPTAEGVRLCEEASRALAVLARDDQGRIQVRDSQVVAVLVQLLGASPSSELSLQCADCLAQLSRNPGAR